NAPLAQDAAHGGLLGVIKIKQAIVLELGMEGEGEQPFLVLNERLAIGDVDEQAGVMRVGAIGQDEDLALLLDDHDTLGAVRNFLHPEGAIEFDFGEGGLDVERRQRVGGGGSLQEAGQAQKAEQSGAFRGYQVHAGATYAGAALDSQLNYWEFERREGAGGMAGVLVESNVSAEVTIRAAGERT